MKISEPNKSDTRVLIVYKDDLVSHALFEQSSQADKSLIYVHFKLANSKKEFIYVNAFASA